MCTDIARFHATHPEDGCILLKLVMKSMRINPDLVLDVSVRFFQDMCRLRDRNPSFGDRAMSIFIEKAFPAKKCVLLSAYLVDFVAGCWRVHALLTAHPQSGAEQVTEAFLDRAQEWFCIGMIRRFTTVFEEVCAIAVSQRADGDNGVLTAFADCVRNCLYTTDKMDQYVAQYREPRYKPVA